MADFVLENYKLPPFFVTLNVHYVCAEWLNIGVTVGLGKEFPSYYVWNLALAKSTFPPRLAPLMLSCLSLSLQIPIPIKRHLLAMFLEYPHGFY